MPIVFGASLFPRSAARRWLSGASFGPSGERFMRVLMSASIGISASPVCYLKMLRHMIGGLESDVFFRVAVPADTVAASFFSFFVGDDLFYGVLSGCWHCLREDRWYMRLIGSFRAVSHVFSSCRRSFLVRSAPGGGRS